MADILIVRRQPLGTFFTRRASRLLPALGFYVLVMSIALAGAAIFGVPNRGPIGAVAALGFVHNYLPPQYVAGVFEHTWSLAVEEHSYLLLGLVTLMCLRNRRAAIAIAGILAALAILNGIRLSADEGYAGQYVYWRTDVRAASILISFGTYLWLQGRTNGRRAGHGQWVSPVSLGVGLTLLLNPNLPEYLHFGVGTALLAIAVGTLDEAHSRFRQIFGSPFLAWFGILSYSLYLWQQPLFMLGKAGVPVMACLGVLTACALWSFYRVEQPARRYINGHWCRRDQSTHSAQIYSPI